MAISKSYETPQGVPASYHRLVKVEVSEATGKVELTVAIHQSSETASAGGSPLWHEYVHIPLTDFDTDPFAVFYPALTSYAGSYLLGGASDAEPVAKALGVSDPVVDGVEVSALELFRRAKIADMRKSRDQEEFSTFAWDGSVFDATAASIGRLIGAVILAQQALAADQPFSVSWTLADNSERTLSGVEMLGVAQALGAHTMAVHAKYKTVKAALISAATLDEMREVAWPVS